MLLKSLTFHAPQTLDDAVELYSNLSDVRILAGGTFLLNSLKLLKRKGTKTPQNLLSLRKIDELKGVSLQNDRLIVRAMTVINDLAESPLLTDNFQVLKTVCKNISTNPIRNMATVGGNLTCRYTWTEMGAVMIALDAAMHFRKPVGGEDVVAAEEFFRNAARADKIFTHVSIPRDKEAYMAYRRVKKTLHVDVPLLTVCVKTNLSARRFRNIRITVNNGVAFAQRDRSLEDFLEGNEIRKGIGQEALDHLDSSIYDKRSDEYKKHMFRVSIRSAIDEIVEKASKNGC
jgi:CO/xanthine dehydrogenase FAD-binding subunit